MRKIIGSNKQPAGHRDGVDLHFAPSSLFSHWQVTSIWTVCRKPFENRSTGHRFSKHVWLFSFSSREESGHAMWKDLPGRPG